MTTENELDVIKTNESNDDKEESSLVINPTEEIKEEEQINIEKPKRAGRKKKDLTSTESFNNDTQPLFEQPVIVEGKRSRKPTSRLELSDLTTPKKELAIPQGNGKPLGEIEYINYQITHASNDVLSRIRDICFGRRACQFNIRKNLREFKGFEFTRDSEEYESHLNNLLKLTKDQLTSISDLLGLSLTGTNEEHVGRILEFLMEPIDEGKPVPERKTSARAVKQIVHIDEYDDEIENGDDDEDAYFDEEEEDDDIGTDEDYIGSDYEVSYRNKDDDPDDFVYHPGRKQPKKRTSIKRSRSRSTPKRKRGTSRMSTRGRKKSKVVVNAKTENDDVPLPDEPMQTNNDDNTTKPIEDNSTTEQSKNEDHPTLPEQNDTTTTTTTADIIPTTS